MVWYGHLAEDARDHLVPELLGVLYLAPVLLYALDDTLLEFAATSRLGLLFGKSVAFLRPLGRMLGVKQVFHAVLSGYDVVPRRKSAAVLVLQLHGLR